MKVLAASIEQKASIANMLPGYLRELGASEEYPYFEAYWTEESRYPYIFLGDSKEEIGFALIRELRAQTLEICEFFISVPYRRASSGQKAVSQLLDLHAGKSWQFNVLKDNKTAYSFWTRVVEKCGGESLQIGQDNDSGNYVFTFSHNSKHGSSDQPLV